MAKLLEVGRTIYPAKELHPPFKRPDPNTPFRHGRSLKIGIETQVTTK